STKNRKGLLARLAPQIAQERSNAKLASSRNSWRRSLVTWQTGPRGRRRCVGCCVAQEFPISHDRRLRRSWMFSTALAADRITREIFLTLPTTICEQSEVIGRVSCFQMVLLRLQCTNASVH